MLEKPSSHIYTVENCKCFTTWKEYQMGRRQVLFIVTFQFLTQEDLIVKKKGARKRQDLQISIIYSISPVSWDVEY